MKFLKIKTAFGNTLVNLNVVKVIYADKRSNGTMFVFDEEEYIVATETFEDISEKILMCGE